MNQTSKFDFIVSVMRCCVMALLAFVLFQSSGRHCFAQNTGWSPPTANPSLQHSPFQPNGQFQPSPEFQTRQRDEPRRDPNTVNASFPEPGEFQFNSRSSPAATQAVHAELASIDGFGGIASSVQETESNSSGFSIAGVKDFVSHQTGKLFGSSSAARTSGSPDWRRMVGGLAVVLGGYFLLVSFVRWINPKGNGQLPTEVVEVLGKTPFGNRQNLQLVRLGNKLLLLLETNEGIQPIAEIEDPAEVQQVVGMCCRQPRHRRNTKPIAADRSNHVAIPALLTTERQTTLPTIDANSVSLTDLARAIETVAHQNTKRRAYYEA